MTGIVFNEMVLYMERLRPAYFCLNCPRYFRARQPDRQACIQDNCIDNQIFTDTGFCQECEIYFYPSSGRTTCIQDDCSNNRFYLATDGKCDPCEDFTYQDPSDNTICIFDECNETERLNINGSCSDC